MTVKNNIAQALLKANIIGLVKGTPVRFKSGILSPVYTDNRKLPANPTVWNLVIKTLASLIKTKKIKFDYIAGIEAAGIPHSAALGFYTRKPSIFVRKEVKGYGLKKRVEGADVKGKRVLLIEDVVSTGGSSVSSIKALRDEGAIVRDCISIVNYNFPQTGPNFKKVKVKIYTLAPFTDIIKIAISSGVFTKNEGQDISIWLKNPKVWSDKHEHLVK